MVIINKTNPCPNTAAKTHTEIIHQNATGAPIFTTTTENPNEIVETTVPEIEFQGAQDGIENLKLRKTLKQRKEEANLKLKNSPSDTSLLDLALINSGDSEVTNDAVSNLLFGKLDLKPVLTQRDRYSAIAATEQAGLEHAKQVQETTPVIPMDLKSFETTVAVKKIKLPNGDMRLGLFINGAPWKYQPNEYFDHEAHQDPFFTAHDIMRHNLLNRNRTTNTTLPQGEYNTGQVLIEKTLLPTNPLQYDGLIANAADAKLEQESGSYSFRRLMEVLSRFQNDSSIPEDSSIELTFKIPPPDITWESTKEKGPKTYYALPEPGYNGYIKRENIPMLERRLQESTCLSYSVARIPGVSLDENVVTTESSPESLNTTPGASGFIPETEAHRYHLPASEDTDIVNVYEIIKDSDGNNIKAKKYCNHPEFGDITWVEGRLLKKGMTPEIIEPGSPISIGQETRIYSEQVSERRTKVYVFSSGIQEAVIAYIDSSDENYTPVYTGNPYQSPEVQSIEINMPGDDKSHAEDVLREYQVELAYFERDFERYQEHIKEILESGTLPIDINVGAGGIFGMSFLSHYENLVRSGHLSQDDPIDIPTIQRGIFKKYGDSLDKLPKSLEEIANETFEKAAPFPPPPFLTPLV